MADETTDTTVETTVDDTTPKPAQAAKKTAAKKPAAKKTAKKPAAKKSTAKKAPAKKPAPRLYERELKDVAQDAAYAVAALVDEAVEFIKELPAKIDQLEDSVESKFDEVREQAPARVKELLNADKAKEALSADKVRDLISAEKVSEFRAQLQDRAKSLTDVDVDVKARYDELIKDLDARLLRFEKALDARAKQGRKVTKDLKADERYGKLDAQVKKFLDQTAPARDQVNKTVESVRKTADDAITSGRKQVDEAREQVKSAVDKVRQRVAS